jgi:rhamnulokinase
MEQTGMAANFLAFDLGAESGRALLGILANGRLQLEEIHRFTNPTGRMNHHLHWNLLAQWEELKTGLRQAARQNGTRRTIHGIGVDTWGVDFGLLGAGGEILGNPVHYRDAWTEGTVETTCQRVGREKIFDRTGIQFMRFNTLFQLVAMRQRHPQLLESAQQLLFMPDLFNYLFTGRRQSELSIASTSQMIDPRTRSWARDLLQALDLPDRILPELIPSASVVGPLSDEVAAECEVDVMPVLAPGCHDTASAVAAVPASPGREDWCYISSGTWSLMGVELSAPVINDKSLAYAYTNEIGVGGRIRFLKNIMGLWLVQECRRHWARDGMEYTYAELTDMARDARSSGSVINPDHAPFMTPGEMPGKIEAFCRQSRQAPPASPGEFVRLCLESLALTYRRTVEGLEDILGRSISTIHIVGGGTQNTLLNQMTADATGRSVIAGPVEATAIGNILAQAMAVGELKHLEEARALVAASFPVQRYEPQDTPAWAPAYARYLELV